MRRERRPRRNRLRPHEAIWWECVVHEAGQVVRLGTPSPRLIDLARAVRPLRALYPPRAVQFRRVLVFFDPPG